MTELERRRCPDCEAVWDVWLGDNGRPESPRGTLCPDCRAGGQLVVGIRDEGENALWRARGES